MRYAVKKPLLSLGIAGLLYVAMLVVSVAGSAGAETPVPKSGERLLVIHDGTSEQGILTRAATIREAFEQARIPLDTNDMVEPGLDEKLVASNYDVNLYKARPVTIVDGTIRKKIMSAYRTPEQIVAHAGMQLHDEDTTATELPADAARDGAAMQLTIKRATPFTLVLYGKRATVYTQAKTVGDMLKDKKITIGKDDTLSVDATAALTPDMTIELWRNGKQTITEDKDIPFDTERIQDGDREVGYREVRTPGVVGKRTVTYEIEMKNGQEVARREIQSLTIKEPVKQVESVGTKMTNTFSGSFAEALARLRGCESGGRYDRNSGNGYYGAYQYDIQTWANWGGYSRADLAPGSVQDEKVWETYKRRGWQPWPSCSKSQGLQDIYR